jgi:hypothetical protein
VLARVIALPLILTHPGNQKTILGDLGRERLPKFPLSGNHVASVGAFALKQGLKFYYSNPLNYEPKLHLNCELVPLDLYVMHANPLLNPIFRRLIKYLGPTRPDPVLQQFPNADQL